MRVIVFHRFSHLLRPPITRMIVVLGFLIVLSFFFVTFFVRFHHVPGQQYGTTLIIVVTPTAKRVQRLADMTRMANTLKHIKGLHWIVVEDGLETSVAVERLLERSGIYHTYLYAETPSEFKVNHSGWAQRNKALGFLRTSQFQNVDNAVVYFGDDDNSYDLRLFENYIRNVKTIGIWPVGLVGGALVEAPLVEDGKIKGFQVIFRPWRTFATDMAGFAVNLNFILNSTAIFHNGCPIWMSEDCFLRQLNVAIENVQPFGWNDNPKDVLVWHTKTIHSGDKGGDKGYTVM